MNTRNKTRFLTQSAAIAGVYIILTMISALFGLSSGVIQIRISEALTILPLYTPAAVPGLFIGCLISNLIAPGSIALDIIFGSVATLIGAIFTRILRKHPFLAPIPPILSNTLIIPYILAYAYKFAGSVPYFMLTVGLGEVLSCGVLGYLLMAIMKRLPKNFFE